MAVLLLQEHGVYPLNYTESLFGYLSHPSASFPKNSEI